MSVPLRNRPMQAFGLAILVEAGLLAATAAILTGAAAAKPALSSPVTITLVSDAPPSELPPKPPQPQPKPKPKPKPKLRLSKPRAPTPPVTAPPLPMPQAPAPLAQKPEAFTEPLSPPPAPAPPAPSGKTDPSLEYAVKVRAAVQAAVYYPPAALAMHFVGRVRVQFHLQDGIPGVAQVLFSSGIGLFDRAALRTVHNAHYPAPPTGLRGADRVYQVWVEFKR
ncbi:MAG TPA: energy transducer TonB [Rhodocyclaceae bacterium]|nr:energy transducer TonB [Rhodocyclaceae bacterium]